jgi:tetratricopeptide (TPR) repeat protein
MPIMKPRRHATPRATGVQPAASVNWGLWALVAATLGLAFVVLKLHGTPFYGVETDLIGDLVPAARELRAGHVSAAHFEFKGPGYPMLLAIAGALSGGDDWWAARCLNLASAAAGAWFALLIARRFLGAATAVFVLLGLFLNPVWLGAAVEAGTDMPVFALSMAATWLVLEPRGRGAWMTAGLLAGGAFLTRYNAVFLPAAAAAALTASHASARRISEGAREGAVASVSRLALYAFGFALPVASWAVMGRALAGEPLRNLNYLNVAYEIYGRNMGWEPYWKVASSRFHSLLDVVRFDPMKAASVLGGNVGSRWWTDIHRLVPMWIGVPGVLGMALVWPRRRGALAVAAHCLFAYLVLAGVFYAPRFFLYLIPFYLMGAGALLFQSPLPARIAAGGAAWRVAARTLPWALAVAMLAISGATAVRTLRTSFESEPTEARLAGEALRGLGPAGARVMARKPQVAFLAGMEHVPMSDAATLLDLVRAAQAMRVEYLFFSGIEARMRFRFLMLSDTSVTLPGIVQIGWRQSSPNHYYALYRFTEEPVDSVRFRAALLSYYERLVTLHPDQARVQWYAAAQILDLGLPREALERLEVAERLDPRVPETMALKAWARFRLGDLAGAGEECQRAIGVGFMPADLLALRGTIWALEGHLQPARTAFERASDVDPLDAGTLLQLGIVRLELGDSTSARIALDRCVALAPGLSATRDSVRAAYAAGGRHGQMLAMIARIQRTRSNTAMLTSGADR